MTAPTIDLGALVEAFRIALQHMSDWEVAYEARRMAALPPSPLTTRMRHLTDAEIEYRRAEQHAANDPQPAPDLPPLPRPVDPAPILPRHPGLSELHADTVRLVEASRADREALERARTKARLSGAETFEAVA